MPSRLIRDGLIESEAVLSLPVEARWLYVTILLSADDVGLFEATEFNLARKADLSRSVIGKLLPMLVDADLVRLYQGPGMRQLGFIPRFRQRLQIQRTKLPAPPPALYADDEDAVMKFNDLAAKKAVNSGASPRPTAGQPPEPNLTKPEENQKREGNNLSAWVADGVDPFDFAWSLYPARPGRSRVDAKKAWAARIAAGVDPQRMIDGVAKYAAYCFAMRTEPRYIKQPETFFGPACHFDSDWTVPVGNGTKSPHSKSIAGMNYNEGFDANGRIL